MKKIIIFLVMFCVLMFNVNALNFFNESFSDSVSGTEYTIDDSYCPSFLNAKSNYNFTTCLLYGDSQATSNVIIAPSAINGKTFQTLVGRGCPSCSNYYVSQSNWNLTENFIINDTFTMSFYSKYILTGSSHTTNVYLQFYNNNTLINTIDLQGNSNCNYKNLTGNNFLLNSTIQYTGEINYSTLNTYCPNMTEGTSFNRFKINVGDGGYGTSERVTLQFDDIVFDNHLGNCISYTDNTGLEITEDTFICSNEYQMDEVDDENGKGITINGDNIILSCEDNTIFDGLNTGEYFIVVNGDNVIIDNCILQNSSNICIRQESGIGLNVKNSDFKTCPNVYSAPFESYERYNLSHNFFADSIIGVYSNISIINDNDFNGDSIINCGDKTYCLNLTFTNNRNIFNGQINGFGYIFLNNSVDDEFIISGKDFYVNGSVFSSYLSFDSEDFGKSFFYNNSVNDYIGFTGTYNDSSYIIFCVGDTGNQISNGQFFLPYWRYTCKPYISPDAFDGNVMQGENIDVNFIVNYQGIYDIMLQNVNTSTDYDIGIIGNDNTTFDYSSYSETYRNYTFSFNSSVLPVGSYFVFVRSNVTQGRTGIETYGSIGYLNILENCFSSWICSGYASCIEGNIQYCNSVIDLNLCGEYYTGDYSEFTPQSCTYTPPIHYGSVLYSIFVMLAGLMFMVMRFRLVRSGDLDMLEFVIESVIIVTGVIIVSVIIG